MNKIFLKDKIGYYISKNVFSAPRSALRTLKTYEIELYTTDTNISVVNGKEYKQKSGNILVAKPGDTRYSINAFECYYAHFRCDDEQVCGILNSLPTVFSPINHEEFSDWFKTIISAQGISKKGMTLYVQGKLLELTGLLLTQRTEQYSGKYKRYISDVNSSCDFMKENMDRQITLADISKTVNLSAGFYHKVFKEIKGITPQAYLTEIRLKEAKSLLGKTNIPLSEIAMLCGFNSQAYFNYVFSKNMSVTPKKYRDKNQVII